MAPAVCRLLVGGLFSLILLPLYIVARVLTIVIWILNAFYGCTLKLLLGAGWDCGTWCIVKLDGCIVKRYQALVKWTFCHEVAHERGDLLGGDKEALYIVDANGDVQGEIVKAKSDRRDDKFGV